MTNTAEESKNQGLLFPIQVVNTVIVIKKLDQMKGRKHGVIGFHFLSGNIKNNPVMSVIGTGNRAGHMDEIGIYQNQISGTGNIFPVVEKENTFPLNNIKNFILCMKVFHPHIEFSITYHLL